MAFMVQRIDRGLFDLGAMVQASWDGQAPQPAVGMVVLAKWIDGGHLVMFIEGITMEAEPIEIPLVGSSTIAYRRGAVRYEVVGRLIEDRREGLRLMLQQHQHYMGWEVGFAH